jgi:stage V sporulation protein S
MRCCIAVFLYGPAGHIFIGLGIYLKYPTGHGNSEGGTELMDVLKVSAKSNPNSVAGALAGVLRERGVAEIQAIGAGALNQAVKAVAIARGFVAPSGVDLICIPAFTDIIIDGEERTAIKLIVEPR